MAERDRSAVNVHFVYVDVGEFLEPCKHNGGERLVTLKQINILDRHAALLERLVRRVDRPLQEEVRIGTDDNVLSDASARLQAQVLRFLGAHVEKTRGAIRHLR